MPYDVVVVHPIVFYGPALARPVPRSVPACLVQHAGRRARVRLRFGAIEDGHWRISFEAASVVLAGSESTKKHVGHAFTTLPADVVEMLTPADLNHTRRVYPGIVEPSERTQIKHRFVGNVTNLLR